MEVIANHNQLCDITTAGEGPLPVKSLKALADFASNDLLSSCGKWSCSISKFSLCAPFHPSTVVYLLFIC